MHNIHFPHNLFSFFFFFVNTLNSLVNITKHYIVKNSVQATELLIHFCTVGAHLHEYKAFMYHLICIVKRKDVSEFGFRMSDKSFYHHVNLPAITWKSANCVVNKNNCFCLVFIENMKKNKVGCEYKIFTLTHLVLKENLVFSSFCYFVVCNGFTASEGISQGGRKKQKHLF